MLSESRGFGFVWSNWSIVRRSQPTSLPVSKDVKRKQKILLHVGTPEAQQISSLLLSAGAENMQKAPASPLLQEAGGNSAPCDEDASQRPAKLRLPAFINITCHPATDVFKEIQLKGAFRMI